MTAHHVADLAVKRIANYWYRPRCASDWEREDREILGHWPTTGVLAEIVRGTAVPAVIDKGVSPAGVGLWW